MAQNEVLFDSCSTDEEKEVTAFFLSSDQIAGAEFWLIPVGPREFPAEIWEEYPKNTKWVSQECFVKVHDNEVVEILLWMH